MNVGSCGLTFPAPDILYRCSRSPLIVSCCLFQSVDHSNTFHLGCSHEFDTPGISFNRSKPMVPEREHPQPKQRYQKDMYKNLFHLTPDSLTGSRQNYIWEQFDPGNFSWARVPVPDGNFHLNLILLCFICAHKFYRVKKY